MKKHLLFFSLMALFPLVANAYDAKVDGIYYNFSGDEATVTCISSTYASNKDAYTGRIIIPESVTYNGFTYSVTTISDYAFAYCHGLTSVTIPNSVTSIGDYAFYYCSSLTSVTIPNSVTSISNYAFSNCSSLTSITIPNSVTSIGNYAFYECSSLTSITIPNSVTSIGNSAFFKCSSLTSLTIPNSVTTIGDYAFMSCIGLTSLTIPNSVTSIGNSAFYNCTSLTSITIPNSVTSIGYGAFHGCSGLTSVKVESGNVKYDSRSNCNAIIETTTNTLIVGCRNTVIPNNVTSIGHGAFSHCSGLTSVTIPNSVTSIGGSAFQYCSGLTYVTIPNSVTSIGNNAFFYCSKLTSFTIPNSVTSIGERAFCQCSGLKDVTIPNSVTSIGEAAFYNCTSLTSITIPKSVTGIGNYAFGYCNGLTSIVVESGNTKYDSRNICNAIIETATNILIAGFKITSIPNSVTSIGDYAFYKCSSLTSVTIPNSVTSIDSWAFSGCSGLTSVTIPNSVTSIGEAAFYQCSGLTSVTSYIKNPFETGSSAFNGIPSDATLYVPAGTVAQYRALADWNRFTNIIEIQDAGGYTKAVLQAMLDAIGQRLDAIGSMINDAEAMYKNLSGNSNIPNDVLAVAEKEWSRMSNYITKFYETLSVYNDLKQQVQVMTGNDDGTLYNMIVALQTTIDQAEDEVKNVIEEMIKTIKYYAVEDMENRLEKMKDNIDEIFALLAALEGVLSHIDEQLGDYYFMRKGTDEFLAHFEMYINHLVETKVYVTVAYEQYKDLLDHHSITTIEDIVTFYTEYTNLQNSINNIKKTTEDSKVELDALDNEFENLEVNFPDENLAYAICPTGLNNGPQIGYKQSFGFVLSTDGMMWFEQKDGADFYLRDADGHYIVATLDGTTQAGTKAEATVWTGQCNGKGNYTFRTRVNSRYVYLGCNGTNENSALTFSNTKYSWTITEFKQNQDHDYDWSIGTGGDFADVNSAMSDSRVKDGDVLQVLPGSIISGEQTITKAVTLRGNGYKMDSKGHLDSNVAQLACYLKIAARYAKVQYLAMPNFEYVQRVSIQATDVTIEGCYLGQLCSQDNYDTEGAIIRKNFIRADIVGNEGYGWLVQNNIIMGYPTTYYDGTCVITNLENATIDHNIIYSRLVSSYSKSYCIKDDVIDSKITNNIIVHFYSDKDYAGTATGTITATGLSNNTVSHNVFTGATPNSNNRGGINAVGDIFVGGYMFTDSYFQLVNNSLAAGYATDGTDCGPWSGAFPYVVGGIGDDDNIQFADATVKALCVANWDTNKDGELSKAEAAAVTSLGGVFYNNTTITLFDELKYFTGLTSINEEDFSGCSSLTSIIIPQNVTRIGGEAFYKCTSLTSITMSNSIESIGVSAFYGCSSLASVTIPNSVTSIDYSAFYGCSGLTTITIPKSVTSVADNAFAGCYGLTSIKVETENTKYDSRNNCNAIIATATNTLIVGCKNTVIPDGVTSIEGSAFYHCGLESITIPNSVTFICKGAFYGCHLKDVYCLAIEVPSADGAFEKDHIEYATLHVPAQSIENYRATNPEYSWAGFGTIVPIESDTNWKLDPTLTTNLENHEFATLDALVNYLLSHQLEESVTVDVADGTYTMDVVPNHLSSYSYSSMEELIKILYSDIWDLKRTLESLVTYYSANNIIISLEAPHEAVFKFYIQYSQVYQYIQGFMAAKSQEMLAQGMSQEEVEYKLDSWKEDLKYIVLQCQQAMQQLVNRIMLTNISIQIDDSIPPIPPFPDPNDLLSLRNIYNILGGSNWTSKKWNIYKYDLTKEDFPGVTFDDEGYVLQINLENNNLRGSINPNPQNWTWQLGLPRLTGLYLQKNNISGDLSPWLAGEDRRGRLKALNMSYNNLTEISDTIPSSITSLILDNQNREWFRPDGVDTDPLKIEVMAKMRPIRLYLSNKQTVVIPTLFTYDRLTQTHSATPNMYIINAEGNDIYGHFTPSTDGTYFLKWGNEEYTEKQDTCFYVRFENPFNGSVYPAYIRYIEGDVNMSGYTDVCDVQTTLNYVLMGGSEKPFNRSAANTYDDNQINVQDIVCMVNIVLNNEAVAEGVILNPSSSRRMLSRAADAMDAQGWLYTQDEHVMLTTANEVGAIDLELKGVNTSQVSLLLNHRQYQMIGRNTENGSRYVIFSPTGKPIPASEEVALLAVSSQTKLIAAQAADMEAEELVLAIGQPTGIEAIEIGQQTTDNKQQTIYNVAGQRLSKMQHGINIINGRKVLK